MTMERLKTFIDRLYNLRGEDSEILAKIEKEKKVATDTKERTTIAKQELQEEITNLTKKKEF